MLEAASIADALVASRSAFFLATLAALALESSFSSAIINATSSDASRGVRASLILSLNISLAAELASL